MTAATAGGCGGPTSATPPPADGSPATRPTVVGDPTYQLQLPGSFPDRVFYLDVYQVVLPFGATSRNPDFWRYVDEERMPPDAKDLLQKNGVRAGLASNDDWDFFKDQIERHPHFARSGSAVAAAANGNGTGQIELPMKENVAEQLIFFFSDRGQPWGRTYQRCSDVFGVSFWPDPRRRAEMVLSLSPVVRATRTERTITIRGDERSIDEVRPEVIYPLNLRLNIPPDRFLVLGLSAVGGEPTSLGHQFLTLPGGVEMREQVLVFVPRITSARRAPAATQNAPDIDAGRSADRGR
jgi:hypothetical protein